MPCDTLDKSICCCFLGKGINMKKFVILISYLIFLLPGNVFAIEINGYTFDENSANLTNKYIMMSVGDTYSMNREEDGVSQSPSIAIADGIEKVHGVNCLRIKYEEPEYELYAQDTDGNVHIFKEVQDESEFVISKDTQIPNIIMPADPQLNDVYAYTKYRDNEQDNTVKEYTVKSLNAQYHDYTNCMEVTLRRDGELVGSEYYLAGTGNLGWETIGGNDKGWRIKSNDDACPNDPNKTAPGICGCGTPDTDTDGDGTADCNDQCPDDPDNECDDTTPPTVNTTNPSANATNVVSANITATFSEAINSSTVTTTTFLINDGSANIAGTVSYNGTTATFTPDVNLGYDTTYSASITTGIKDLAGNALQSDYTWSFTTGPAQTGAENNTGGDDGGGCFIGSLTR